MTLDEAIEHCEEVAKQNRELARKITKDQCLYTDRFDEYDCIKCAKAHEQLAEWLKELKEYKDKNEPKPVIYSGDGYADGYLVYDYAECPNCGREFEEDRDEWEMPYCCACGQALSWEVKE